MTNGLLIQNRLPRVALFADTFHEVNGAANVIRRLERFAQENNFPFLCIRAGKETRFLQEKSLQIVELKRSRTSFPIDGELKYDPLLWRYKKLIKGKLDEFKPDVVHVTGLNDVSQLGFYFAHYERIAAVASWHTNTHEYAARRLISVLRWLPGKKQKKVSKFVEDVVMRGLMKLNFLAQMQLAPNEELVREIQEKTCRPSFLMSRGVDTKFFTPDKRNRTDSTFVLGYVGRLRAEKNVRFLAEVEKALQKSGVSNYKFVIVGEGDESSWLQNNLSNVELTGVLRGENLARAFAGMDLFVFPSQTDAFGNVVLEAMAAGVPSIVMPQGGPKFLIEQGVTGYAAKDETDFIQKVVECAKEPEKVKKMRDACRASACKYSWEQIFENVYDKYKIVRTMERNIKA